MLKLRVKFKLLIILIFVGSSILGQDQNLLIHYPFSGNYEDQSLNNFHGTPLNIIFTENRFGLPADAAYFDGTSCIELPNDQKLKPQFPFSFSFWIKPEVQFLIAEGLVGTDQFEDNYYGAFISILSSGKIMMSYGDGCGETGPACRVSEISNRIFNNDEWYHIAAIYNSSSSMELYVNGCKEITTSSGTGTQEISYSNVPGSLGKKDHSDIFANPIGFYHGTIDDFYYWDKSISETEIEALVDGFFNSENILIEHVGCQNDGFFVEVNGTIYNELNPTGFEQTGGSVACPEFTEINLQFLPTHSSIRDEFICDNPNFSIEIENQIYDINNPSGSQTFINQFGCDSISNINLIFLSSSMETFEYQGCEGDDFFIEINKTRYDEINPSGTEILVNSVGCDSILKIDLSYDEITTGNFEYQGCQGDEFSIEINNTIYDELNPTGFEVLTNSRGCDSLLHISLDFTEIPQCDLYLPNIIISNSQYPNNSFEIHKEPNCNFEFQEILIFDRWGNRIFYSNSEDFSWLGFYNGDLVSNGVYTYKLSYSIKNKIFSKKGSITFLRD